MTASGYTVQQMMDVFGQSLASFYDKREADSIAIYCLEDVSGLPRMELLLKKNMPLQTGEVARLKAHLARLRKHEPVQYVLGYVDFAGLRLSVDPRVLIPRPETEELCQWVSNDMKGKSLRVLDVGTGSGCIAIALKKTNPLFRVTAADISPGAIALAAGNALQNHLHVEFELYDVFDETEPLMECDFDIIVSNPPYIPDKDKNKMQQHVINYEPHAALFVPAGDPLQYYRRIAVLASQGMLAPGGALYLEIHEEMKKETEQLLAQYGFDTETRKDIHGKYRMIKGRFRQNS